MTNPFAEENSFEDSDTEKSMSSKNHLADLNVKSDLKVQSDKNENSITNFKDPINSQINGQIDTSEPKEEYPDDLNPFGDDEDDIFPSPDKSKTNPGFKTSTPQSPTRKVNLVMANQINGSSINGNSPTTKSTDDIPVKSK